MEKLSLRNACRRLLVALACFACAGKSQGVGHSCVGVFEAAIKSCRKSPEQAENPELRGWFLDGPDS
jgi:hypothetical protein